MTHPIVFPAPLSKEAEDFLERYYKPAHIDSRDFLLPNGDIDMKTAIATAIREKLPLMLHAECLATSAKGSGLESSDQVLAGSNPAVASSECVQFTPTEPLPIGTKISGGKFDGYTIVSVERKKP